MNKKKESYDNTIVKYVTSLEQARLIIEAMQIRHAYKRLDFIIGHCPEFLELTHEEIGQLSGLSREAVTRAFNKKIKPSELEN